MKNPKVSVIIPVYNGQRTLRLCLGSILDQTYKNYEVIVVDNNSTDNTKNIIKEFQTKNKIIKYAFEKEQKIGAARNTGEKLVKGSIVVMTDSDCIVYPDWIENIIEPIINKEYAAVQGFEENMNNNFWGKNIQKQNERRIRYLEKAKDAIGMIDTKNFAISMEVLKIIGFTDRKYNGNDTDLSIRFQMQNLKLKFLSNIKVKHFNPFSCKDIMKRYFNRAAECAKISKDHKHYLKHTSFLKQTNQTVWTFCKFFPGLLKTLLIYGPGYTYFDFITGISWRAGLLYEKLNSKKNEKSIQ